MQQRLATLFVDIAGSTRLLVRHPPETVLGVVQCFMTLVTEVASAHGGRVGPGPGCGRSWSASAPSRGTSGTS